MSSQADDDSNDHLILNESDTDSDEYMEPKCVVVVFHLLIIPSRDSKASKRKPGRKSKMASQKRGRPRKESTSPLTGADLQLSSSIHHPSNMDQQSMTPPASASARKRGRPKGSGKKQKAVKREVESVPYQQEEEEEIQLDKDTPFAKVEAIAEKTNKEIEDLENALANHTSDEHEKVRIMAEVKRKREKLMKLINFLENALVEEESNVEAVQSSEPVAQ